MRRRHPCEHYTLVELESGTVCFNCDDLRPRPPWLVQDAAAAAAAYAPRWEAILRAVGRGVPVDEVMSAPEVVATVF